MAQMTVVYWRDIPAQVIVKEGAEAAKRQLSPRFQEAIDEAAMRAGAHESDAYMADWRQGNAEPCGDDIAAAADAEAARLEAAYDDTRLAGMIRSGGRESL